MAGLVSRVCPGGTKYSAVDSPGGPDSVTGPNANWENNTEVIESSPAKLRSCLGSCNQFFMILSSFPYDHPYSSACMVASNLHIKTLAMVNLVKC